MTKLEELLKETDFTAEEWEIYRKVEKHNWLEDMYYVLNVMLEVEEITQEEYDLALENAQTIIEKYDKWLEYEWIDTMKDAIRWVIGE